MLVRHHDTQYTIAVRGSKLKMGITICNKENITGVILAGGQGSRLGHQDKGLVQLAGCPLIEHVIDNLSPQVATLLISANRNLDRYQDYHYPVITDQSDEFQGPLAGIASALHYTKTPYLLTAPCDSPNPPADIAQRLCSVLLENDADLAVADDGQRIHPVFCLMKASVEPSLQKQLAQGERKIDLWFSKIKTVTCDFSDQAEAFKNINTLEELQQTEALYEQH